MRHVAALDGIRGSAILLVLLSHTWLTTGTNRVERLLTFWASGGWSGVDLFFVLSGFLITGILVDSRNDPNYFRNFYVRRILRIFPLYYAVLFFFFLIGPLLPPAVRPNTGVESGDQIWFWLYLSNVWAAFHNTWGNSSIAVTWSLAIEEQFYLLWALIAFVLTPRRLLKLTVTLIGAAFLWRTSLVLLSIPPLAIYVLLPSQMDAIAAGAAVALLLRTATGAQWLRRVAPRSALVSGASLAAIGATAGGFDYADPLLQTVGYSLIAVLYASLLALIVTSASPGLNRVGEAAPLRVFGKYSYGIYLLHRPVIQIVERTGFAPALFPIVIGSTLPAQIAFTLVVVSGSLLVAALSWHLFEARLLRLKRNFPLGSTTSLATETNVTDALASRST
jgi:peptidoglycan/LPS O-acetylase OafA/YrhL